MKPYAISIILLLGLSVTACAGVTAVPTETPTPLKTEPVEILVTATSSPIPITLTPTETFTPTTTEIPSEITDSKWVEMVVVLEGEFIMGSDAGDRDESPVHMVYLDTYYIDKYEVTNASYSECVEASVCDLPFTWPEKPVTTYINDPQYAQHPVVYVNWNMAKAYCEWRGARLPSEAEWEKAARGTDGRIYPWGNEFDEKTYCDYANYSALTFDEHGNYSDQAVLCVGGTSPVGSYENGISPYGAYDMAGNAWEWVADIYSEQYYASSPAVNPLGPESGGYRVLRGGAFYTNHNSISAANRLKVTTMDFVVPATCSRKMAYFHVCN